MALVEEIRCAKNALAASFDNSEDHNLVVMIFSGFTQFAYIHTKD